MNRTTVSHCRIIERLGGGGIGVICKANNTSLKWSVALKVLSHDPTCDEQAKNCFVLEAQSASTLHYPCVSIIGKVNEAADDELLVLHSLTAGKRYNTTEETMPEIGGKLNINGIVEESILRDRNRVWIIAQLTDCSIDRYLSAMSSIRARSARQRKPVWHVDVYYNTPGGFP